MGMDKVHHKQLGTGEVISKDVIDNYTYIMARFHDGTERRFCIPLAFEKGILTAEGSLQEEVEKAIEEKKARSCKIAAAAPAPAHPAARRTRSRRKASAKPAGPIEAAYEKHLINAGYSTETPSGLPSTVNTYIRAVESVLTEEGMSWDTLKTDIANIVPIYDVGGKKELIGSRSNSKVISALKSFEDFVNTP